MQSAKDYTALEASVDVSPSSPCDLPPGLTARSRGSASSADASKAQTNPLTRSRSQRLKMDGGYVMTSARQKANQWNSRTRAAANTLPLGSHTVYSYGCGSVRLGEYVVRWGFASAVLLSVAYLCWAIVQLTADPRTTTTIHRDTEHWSSAHGLADAAPLPFIAFSSPPCTGGCASGGEFKYDFGLSARLFDIPHGNYSAKEQVDTLEIRTCDVIRGSLFQSMRTGAFCIVGGGSVVGHFGDPVYRYLKVEVTMDEGDLTSFADLEMYVERRYSLYRPPEYEDGAVNLSSLISFHTRGPQMAQTVYVSKLRATIGTWLGIGMSSKAIQDNWLSREEWVQIEEQTVSTKAALVSNGRRTVLTVYFRAGDTLLHEHYERFNVSVFVQPYLIRLDTHHPLVHHCTTPLQQVLGCLANLGGMWTSIVGIVGILLALFAEAAKSPACKGRVSRANIRHHRKLVFDLMENPEPVVSRFSSSSSDDDDDIDEDECRLHVRGVGGKYESEVRSPVLASRRGGALRLRREWLQEALRELFGLYGTVVRSAIRHRVDKATGRNTSWALVEMSSAQEADAALRAASRQDDRIPSAFTIALYSNKRAARSSRGMRQVLAALPVRTDINGLVPSAVRDERNTVSVSVVSI